MSCILLRSRFEAGIHSLCVLSCMSQLIKCRCTNLHFKARVQNVYQVVCENPDIKSRKAKVITNTSVAAAKKAVVSGSHHTRRREHRFSSRLFASVCKRDLKPLLRAERRSYHITQRLEKVQWFGSFYRVVDGSKS